MSVDRFEAVTKHNPIIKHGCKSCEYGRPYKCNFFIRSKAYLQNSAEYSILSIK